MPRPKKEGHIPKTRSRNGCWPCKGRKVKCGEEKPQCLNCERQGEACDYSIRLNWGGRAKRENTTSNTDSGSSRANSPYQTMLSFDDTVPPLFQAHSPGRPHSRRKLAQHGRSQSATSIPTSEPEVDPDLTRIFQTQSHPVLSANAMFDGDSPPQEPRSQPTSVPFGVFEYSGSFDYPSPAATSFDACSYSNANYAPFTTHSMPPPNAYPTPTHRQYEVMDSMPTHQRSYSADSPAASDPYSPPCPPPNPYSPFNTMPLTPNSTIGTDEPVRATSGQTPNAHIPVDPRRLSVLSLLSGPPGDSTQSGRQYPVNEDEYTIYGYDTGLPDIDMPQNDDQNPIAVSTPQDSAMDLDGDSPEAHTPETAFDKGGYYAKPIPIKISKSLEPLPPLLLENPMNLLYFHHFIDHTARILVPHDCEKNPFRTILPGMAVKDENIMSLLLAYSASHRARVLCHDEPANRIAMWVTDVFPKLRQSLANPSTISNAALASAIMMASLEIISPNTFEVPIAWQDHLSMARQMIIARGGPKTMEKSDHAAYFLSRWFAYLDVIGSLSGNKNDTPLGSWYWNSANESADTDFQIDCLYGFTNRCVGLLAGIAELAKEVEPLRIAADGTINTTFRPSPEVAARAETIRQELWKGLTGANAHKGCTHRSSRTSSSSEITWDATEIDATNEMFHWAGLIHLYRRVHNYPSSHPAVQQSVSQIIELLFKVRKGSSAEACLLFPMFAAGCDALDQGQREKVLERFRGVEGSGMVQLGRARGVMERVWETGGAWEGLIEGEFLG
ncbi:hypothetical protein DPSP01_002203 [Paraphaeosphaeria sporulosa]